MSPLRSLSHASRAWRMLRTERLRRIARTAVLAAAALSAPAVPSAAQERLSLLDLFSVDALLQRAVQSGILALRTQFDLTYGGLTVDLLSGKIAMSEVRAWPLPEWDRDGTCEVEIERISLRSAALDRLDDIRLKFQILGTAFPISCLPPDLQEPAGAIGLSELSVPRMTVDMTYGLPASDANMRLHADVSGLGVVDIHADFAYFWFDGREDMEEPEPIMFLEHASARFEDDGLYARAAPLMPPPLPGPGSGLFLEGALGQELLSANRRALNDDTAGLSPEQTAFLASLAAAWPAFAADPQALIVETTMQTDVFLDLEVIDSDPRDLFEGLKPRVALQSVKGAPAVSTDLLRRALSDFGAPLSDDERRRVGLALVTGDGAPQYLPVGASLLEGLETEGDGAVAAALATAYERSDPATAYRAALRGGAAGAGGMVALLDRLEQRLSFREVLDLQAAVIGAPEFQGDAPQDLAEIRSEAAQHLSGKGRTRSYAHAAAWSALGAAAGDAEASDIQADLDERARLAGPDGLAAWSAVVTQAQRAALEAWIAGDLGTLLAR